MVKILVYQKSFFFNPLPPVVQPRVADPYIEDALTLELVKEMHINNTNAIALLNFQSKWSDVIGYSVTIVVIVVIIFIFINKRHENKNHHSENYNLHVVSPISNIPDKINEPRNYTISRVSQIPYF